MIIGHKPAYPWLAQHMRLDSIIHDIIITDTIDPIDIGLFGALWYWRWVHCIPADFETSVKPQVFVQIEYDKSRKVKIRSNLSLKTKLKSVMPLYC